MVWEHLRRLCSKLADELQCSRRPVVGSSQHGKKHGDEGDWKKGREDRGLKGENGELRTLEQESNSHN